MAESKRANEPGAIGGLASGALRALRRGRGLSTTGLAERLSELGRPIPASGITRVERGQRRIDVDDLVALADALGVSPVRLLLPVDDHGTRVAITPNREVTASQAWAWVLGRRPLPDSDTDAATFRRDSVPTWERAYETHTEVQTADELTRRLKLVLHARDLAADESTPAGIRQVVDASELHSPDGLRDTLKRLADEVEDLLADDG